MEAPMNRWLDKAPGIALLLLLTMGVAVGFARQSRWPSGVNDQAVEVSRLLWNLQEAHLTLEGRHFSSEDLERSTGGTIADLIKSAGFEQVQIVCGPDNWKATFQGEGHRFLVAGGTQLFLFRLASETDLSRAPPARDVLETGEIPGGELLLKETPVSLFNRRRR